MKPLIVLAGPTAVGKTDLSLDLAKEIGGEIVSADSMQVYRGMDIGTAKATPEERRLVPHHLIDIREPSEEFHVVDFQREAKAAMEGIWSRGHIPILTGGTGFYIQAVTRDIDFTETASRPSLRKDLEREALEEGPERLYERLLLADPKAAEEIHPHNIKRIIRALEYYEESGERISDHNRQEKERTTPYNLLYLVLTRERPELYRRIDLRVDTMMEEGLLEEVKSLREKGYTRELTSMQGLGYKELLAFLEGECTLEEAVYTIKRDTRHFAKRQITWFKREKDAVWVPREEVPGREELLGKVLQLIKEKNIGIEK